VDDPSQRAEAPIRQTAPAIVVIDDDASVRWALQQLLQSAGLTVETFATASEFLDADCWAQTACLVLDIHLPGMSGFELAEYLAVSGVPIPTVFITALDDVATREQVNRAGAVGYLRKSFAQNTLIEAISRAIEQDASE
jgi:FixJ family two-component response regulator